MENKKDTHLPDTACVQEAADYGYGGVGTEAREARSMRDGTMNRGTVVCTLAPEAWTPNLLVGVSDKIVNSRNSEGSFIRTKDGRILFIYTRYMDNVCHDEANADIAYIESSDEGLTWSEHHILFTAREKGYKNIMSVSARRMANGDIGLFYLCNSKEGNRRSQYVLYRSADEGATWTDPVFCIDIEGYYVVNNDRVLMHSSGRIIIPAAYNLPMPGGRTILIARDRFFFSDDDGRTWKPGLTTVDPTFHHSETGLQEPGLVELAGGVVWGYARTDMSRQYEFFSFDRGENWTSAAPSVFTSPGSPMLIKRNPYNEKLYAVWNPIPIYPGTTIETPFNGGRTPLVMAESSDEGKTWSKPLVLEDEPELGYAYPAMHFEPNYMLLAYCAGRPEDGCSLNRTLIRRIEY